MFSGKWYLKALIVIAVAVAPAFGCGQQGGGTGGGTGGTSQDQQMQGGGTGGGTGTTPGTVSPSTGTAAPSEQGGWTGGGTGGASGTAPQQQPGTVCPSTGTTTPSEQGGGTGGTGGATGTTPQDQQGGGTGGASGGMGGYGTAPSAGGSTGGAGGGETGKERTQLNIFGGYSAMDMKDVNNALEQLAGPLGSTTKISNGYFFSGELLFPAGKNLVIGPRAEYLMASQGKAKSLLAETKEDLSLIPVMVGGRYNLKNLDPEGMSFNDKWGLNVGLFAGYGWASGKTDVSSNIVSASFNTAGQGFVGDVLLGWEYGLSKAVSLGIDLGYRYAPISEMKAQDNVPLLGITKDTVLTDNNGNKIKHDFSGFLAALGLKFRM